MTPDEPNQAPDGAAPETYIQQQSGINPKGEPFVQLIVAGKVVAQMDPQQARDHALAILASAEAAEQDAFMLSFAREVMGTNDGGAYGLLMHFREFREKLGKSYGGPTMANRDKWVAPRCAHCGAEVCDPVAHVCDVNAAFAHQEKQP